MWLSQDVSEIHTAGAEFGSLLAAQYIFLGMSGISQCLLNWYKVLHEVLSLKGLLCPDSDWHERQLFTESAEEVPQLVPRLLNLYLHHRLRNWQFVLFGLVLFFSEVHVRLVGSQKMKYNLNSEFCIHEHSKGKPLPNAETENQHALLHFHQRLI